MDVIEGMSMLQRDTDPLNKEIHVQGQMSNQMSML